MQRCQACNVILLHSYPDYTSEGIQVIEGDVPFLEEADIVFILLQLLLSSPFSIPCAILGGETHLDHKEDVKAST